MNKEVCSYACQTKGRRHFK